MSAITVPINRIMDELNFLDNAQKLEVIRLVRKEREREYIEDYMSYMYVPDPNWHSFYGACNSKGTPICFLPKRKTYPTKHISIIRVYGETIEDARIRREIAWIKEVIGDRYGCEAVATALEVASIEFLNEHHQQLFGF